MGHAPSSQAISPGRLGTRRSRRLNLLAVLLMAATIVCTAKGLDYDSDEYHLNLLWGAVSELHATAGDYFYQGGDAAQVRESLVGQIDLIRANLSDMELGGVDEHDEIVIRSTRAFLGQMQILAELIGQGDTEGVRVQFIEAASTMETSLSGAYLRGLREHHERGTRWLAAALVSMLLTGATATVSIYVHIRQREGARSLLDRMAVARDALEQSDQRFRALVQHAPGIILLVNPDLTIKYASPAVTSILGYEPDEMVGADLGGFVHPDDPALIVGEDHAICGDSDAVLSVQAFRAVHKDGSWRWLEGTISNRLNDPVIGAVVSTLRDVTDLITQQQKVDETASQFQVAFFRNPQPMYIYDRATFELLEVNDALLQRYGYSRQEMLARHLWDIRPTADFSWLKGESDGWREGTIRLAPVTHQTRAGEQLSVEITGHHLDFGGRPAALIVATDITRRLQLTAQLEHQAFHDALTGLANRASFVRQLGAVSEGSRLQGMGFTLFFFDLDNFKAINDALGHDAGDDLLRHVAMQLQRSHREEDFAARLGGDEFMAILPEVTDPDQARALAERMRVAIATPIILSGQVVQPSCSIGIVIAEPDGEASADQLMRCADVAMYAAKQLGKGQSAIYHSSMDQFARDRLILQGELQVAIATGQLMLHYQPMVHVGTGRVQGVEALLRWNHPVRGLLLPEQFLPLATESGLICDIDAWVVETVLATAREFSLTTNLPEPLRWSVNLSSVRLEDSAFVDRMVAAVKASPVALVLELSVTTEQRQLRTLRDAILLLRRHGVTIVIDAVGSASIPLNDLFSLSVDGMKLAREMVQDYGRSPVRQAAVEGIAAFAGALGLGLSAVGVESREQVAALRNIGCTLVQGHAFADAVPIDELPPYLTGRMISIHD